MKKTILNSCIILAIVLAAFGSIPPQPVQAFYAITDTQVWTGIFPPIISDIVVSGSGNLTIQTTLTISCSDAAPSPDGLNPRIEIIATGGGTLNIESAVLQGESTGGCWQGVVFKSGSYGHVTGTEIRDAVVGIHIEDAVPEISGNQIHDLIAPDGTFTDPNGESAYGIWFEQTSEGSAKPVFHSNIIENIQAGAGWDSDASTPGGSGGHASGIWVQISGTSYTPEISGNQISNIRAGDGGDGSVGEPGLEGEPPSPPENFGEPGGDGYPGLNGGGGGSAYGIYRSGLKTNLISNEIYAITAGDGGNGGTGGAGGFGGFGGTNENSNIAEMGGSGGAGGSGGYGGIGGLAFGIYRYSLTGPEVIESNQISEIQGGAGGFGGSGGIGGFGGTGAMGNDFAFSGASGGTGGSGGSPGGSAYGGDACGVCTESGFVQVNANTINGITAGDGASGATGAAGGTGGTGGMGGTDGEGNGGPGGTGGLGGSASPGGDGNISGAAYGLSLIGQNLDDQFSITNNDVFNVTSGWAGNGGLGAAGGTGGIGGPGGTPGTGGTDGAMHAPLSGAPGTGGNGGDGGPGSSGGNGGNVNITNLVWVTDNHVVIVNNTLLNPFSPLAGGSPGNPGTPGAGGEGGLPNGVAGGTDTTPIIPAISGNGGLSVGIGSVSAGKTITVNNNIIVDQNGYANGIGLASIGSLFLDDYNDVFGWMNRYSNIAHGVHTINTDPSFWSSSDHRLRSNSPCRNQGVIPGYDLPDFDHDGNPRVVDMVDMGAYEYPPFEVFLPLLRKP